MELVREKMSPDVLQLLAPFHIGSLEEVLGGWHFEMRADTIGWLRAEVVTVW